MSASPLRAVDLRDRRGEPEVRQLVSYAVGYPTEEKMDAVMGTYAGTARRLVGFEDGAHLVGVVGLEESAEGLTIHHLAVSEEHRRGGVGRRALEWVAAEYPSARHIELETHADAVEFYRRCGFTAQRVVDPRWPEVERYRCILRLPATTPEAGA